jgi:hypothetical protein
MDPFLEDPALWPAFHHQFVMCLYQILLPGLTDRYRARVFQRCYRAKRVQAAAALADDPHEDYIEVRQRSDSRLVTLMEVVSPANKTTGSGRAAYLETRRAARTANANLVEIDLVLQGSAPAVAGCPASPVRQTLGGPAEVAKGRITEPISCLQCARISARIAAKNLSVFGRNRTSPRNAKTLQNKEFQRFHGIFETGS